MGSIGGMGDSSARMLQLLSLLQDPHEWPGSELAERLGVSARTIRRDVDRLRDLGYPVEATLGATGGYRLTGGAAMPPLQVDDDEAVAIAVGLCVAAGHAIEGVEESSVRALAKVLQVLPPRLRHRVSSLGTATVARLGGEGGVVHPEDLTVMAVAITNHERLRFSYRASDGTKSDRRAEPHGLVSIGHRWYLVAFDIDRDDWRIFRADRVREPRPSGGRGAQRQLPAATPGDYVVDRLMDLAPTYRAVVTLHLPIAEVTGRSGTNLGDLEPIDEWRCRLTSHPDTLDWLKCEFDVHGPPELIEHVHSLGVRLSRAAPMA
jgi:predicted DNA-binding transcriptional regulator YafY